MHLAGENIAGGRWTAGRKALLRASRVGPTQLLARTLAGLKKKPKVLVSASAIGYYGNRGDAWVTENDPPADDFLGRLSAGWEGAAEPARQAGIRVVHPRFGIVLSPAGGALGKMPSWERASPASPAPSASTKWGRACASSRPRPAWAAVRETAGRIR